MSARVKMAREAVFDAMIEHGPDGHTDGHDKITGAALAAADAVMFDDAAVERAAKALYEASGRNWELRTISEDLNYVSHANAAITALKGDGQ